MPVYGVWGWGVSEQQATTEYQYGLSEIAVDLKTSSGEPRTVPGLAHEACPGLAVTMLPFGVFAVTHINTGYRLCHRYQRASSALLAMSCFALIADMEGRSWADLDQDEAVKLINEAADKEVPFDGATRTSVEGIRKLTVGEWFKCHRIPIFDEFPWEETDPFDTAISNLEKIEVPA